MSEQHPKSVGEHGVDECLYWEYLAAKDRSDATRDLHDAILTGQAWSRWLAEFVPDPTARRAVHGNVVQFHK